ncbi:MAG: dockerin type I domain-containing protein [Weeksellaceae bacterium]
MLQAATVVKHRHMLKILSFILVTGISATGLFWYINEYIYKSSASFPIVQATMVAPTESVMGDEFNVSVRLSGQQVSGVELYLLYSGDVVKYYKEDHPTESGMTQLPASYFAPPVVETISDQGRGTKLLKLTLVTLGQQTVSDVQLNFRFTGKVAGASAFTMVTDAGNSRIVGPDSTGTATYFEIQPLNPTANTTIITGPDRPAEDPAPTVIPTIIAGNSPIPTRPVVTPTQTLTLAPSIRPSTRPVITLAPTFTPNNPTATPTQTQTNDSPTGAIIVNFSIKLQGVTRQPIEAYRLLDTVVQAEDSSGRGYLANIVKLNIGANGIAAGQAVFPATTGIRPGSNYTLYIKPAKHIRKKICEDRPVEFTPGSYRCLDDSKITLAAGEQTMNFTGVYLLGGDLPTQDGVVNARDIIQVRSQLGSSTVDAVAKSDLNFDGIVDSQDYTIVLSALGFKFDEE